MKIVIIFLALAFFSMLGQSTIRLSQGGKISQRRLQEDGLIEMIETNEVAYPNHLEKSYYVLKVVHKEKSKAYYHMKSLFTNIAKYLKKKKIIPNESTLIKSQIKPHFLNRKRKWQFTTIFVIYGNHEELSQCQNYFERFAIQKLKAEPSINFLNKKFIVLQLFNKAKSNLLKLLEKYREFQIKQVVKIQIKGSHIKNEDIIEQQIENSFNNNYEMISDNVVSQEEPHHNDFIELKILFQVAKIQNQGSSDDDDLFDQEQSCDESQTQSQNSQQSN